MSRMLFPSSQGQAELRADILSRVTTDFQELESELRIPGGGDFSTHVVT